MLIDFQNEIRVESNVDDISDNIKLIEQTYKGLSHGVHFKETRTFTAIHATNKTLLDVIKQDLNIELYPELDDHKTKGKVIRICDPNLKLRRMWDYIEIPEDLEFFFSKECNFIDVPELLPFSFELQIPNGSFNPIGCRVSNKKNKRIIEYGDKRMTIESEGNMRLNQCMWECYNSMKILQLRKCKTL